MKRSSESPFKQRAHDLVDELSDDATFHDLADRVRLEIELDDFVTECERRFSRSRDHVSARES
jgi:hypothetical protein